MSVPNHKNHSLPDFLADKNFKRWIKNPTLESDLFWNEFQNNFPQKIALVQQARLVILAYKVEEQDITPSQVNMAWQNIAAQNAPVSYQFKPQNIFLDIKWYAAAASIVLLIVAGTLAWNNYSVPEIMVYQTKYGQLQNIVLPDGSKVTLNANSRLEVNQKWSDEATREVKLTGEAYFEVEKKPKTKQKFVVHTSELDVVVLGTSFDVNDRNIQTSVALKEGSVRIELTHKNQVVLMKQGELVEFTKADNSFVKKDGTSERFYAWKDNKLVFENTSIREVASLIQENYGLKVSFTNEALSKRKISGTIPNDNLELLLNSLETIFNIKIRKESEQLIFEK